MKARIYRPTRSVMQSGQGNTHKWLVEFKPESSLYIEPLMGWTGSHDTTRQVSLYFDTEAAAIEYAKKAGLEFELAEPKTRVIKPKSYAANFAYKAAQ